MGVAALVLAAGRGERLGHDLPKGFVPLEGEALLVHALRAMAAVPEVDLVVPVIPESEAKRFESLAGSLAGVDGLAPWVGGGEERQDSTRAGLDALPDEAEWVAVHDAARPLVAVADVSRVVNAAREQGAALLAVPVRDTIKRVVDGRVVETPPRAECWAAQTPQVFRRELLAEAIEKAVAEGRSATDDAELVEWLGQPVAVVEGSPENFKITSPDDLEAAARILRARQG